MTKQNLPTPAPYILNFEQLGFGMFVHYGLYFQLNSGEWIYNQNGSLSMEEYEKLTQEELDRYMQALEAINSDEAVMHTYSMVVNLTLIIASLSILIGYLVLELLMPLWLGNGQTLGKKIFGIALMRNDGVKVTPFMMFVRTILGKYTLETMIPVLIVIMLLFQMVGITGTLILGLILLLQVILLIATKTNSTLHDLLACTVAVDMASQMIFDSPEALLEHKKRISAEAAKRAEY